MNGAHKQSIEEQEKARPALAVPPYGINAVIRILIFLLLKNLFWPRTIAVMFGYHSRQYYYQPVWLKTASSTKRWAMSQNNKICFMVILGWSRYGYRLPWLAGFARSSSSPLAFWSCGIDAGSLESDERCGLKPLNVTLAATVAKLLVSSSHSFAALLRSGGVSKNLHTFLQWKWNRPLQFYFCSTAILYIF